MKIITILLLTLAAKALAGPYPAAAGQPGSTAIAASDPRFRGWATVVTEYLPGAELDPLWQDVTRGLGPAEGLSDSIVGLGRGGSITLGFSRPISDGEGFDFAVFENSFSDFFLELAFVEVSSDGVNFVRFPNDSLTEAAVLSFGLVDPTEIIGFAGKYRGGFGVPFDLSELPESATLHRGAIRYLRLVDVVGGMSLDTSGDVVYDPFPTTGSAGFDLDAVGVIHQQAAQIEVTQLQVVDSTFKITWASVSGESYTVMSLNEVTKLWEEQSVVIATGALAEVEIAIVGNERALFQIRQE